MKKYFDKIILIIFYVLCILAFLLLAIELPNILDELFETSIFKKRNCT